MTGTLVIQPQTAGDEGGQIDLYAPSQNNTLNGISIDNYKGLLRFFGINSADGISKTNSTVFDIDVYGKIIDAAGQYTFKGLSAKATSATSATYSSTSNYAKNSAKASSATSATYSSTANYAKTAGTANISNSLRTNKSYTDIFSTTLTSSHECWNKLCYVTRSTPITNDPEPENTSAAWYEVLTFGEGSGVRAVQIVWGCYGHQRKMNIRYKHDTTWSSWIRMIDENCFSYDSSSNTLTLTI